MATIQKFAFLPKIVWTMKTRDYHYGIIWLCWYWDEGKQNNTTSYYRLTDDNEEPMKSHRYLRTHTNRW
ncbi:hypothetical protein [Sulfurimonas sp.]|uniref:hypothetical protein n=1 Tax=Sulfurimonas sp. TaxID=2022749 RepID=UPI00260DFA95|nr:hypothetical protein [Sulfurimonas sp.]MDD3450950.1 hypothetical protein [Sulfurimonas sp.]